MFGHPAALKVLLAASAAQFDNREHMSLRRWFLLPLVLLAVSLTSSAATPTAGETAPDFTLPTINGARLTLSTLTGRSTVVLVLLRGYPGYQCPFSQQLFDSYQQQAANLAAMGAEVVFVYPGSDGKDLSEDALQMTGTALLPSNVHVVLDPNYSFTNLYGLRWNAANQTVYPTTFVLNREGMVYFVHKGLSASDQTRVTDTLAVVNAQNNSGSKDAAGQ